MSLRLRYVAALIASMFLAGLTACSVAPAVSNNISHSTGASGRVHGGQQPVANSQVQLYAAGSGGDGTAAMALMAIPVTTDAGGNFNLTPFTCPANNPDIYLAAIGGDPLPATANPQLALLAAIGPCSTLTSTSFVNINELTTIAAASALAPYASSVTNMSSGSSDANALAAAFSLANEYVSFISGQTPGSGMPSGDSVPSELINTLGDIIGACINSPGGVAGDTSACGTLFSLTTPSGSSIPTNTFVAALNLANNPTLNTTALFNLAQPTAPFQPILSIVPPNLAVSLTLPSGITLSPSPLNFPAMTVDFQQELPVTIMNGGSTALAISSFVIAGPNSSDFTIDTTTSNCGTTLNPGISCAEYVVFSPQAAGARLGYLQMNSNAPNPVMFATLQGTGNAPANAGPITVSLSSVQLYAAGDPQPFTLTNAGNTPLNISRILLAEGTSSSSANPALTINFVETNNCGSVLQAQSICTINVSENTNGANPNATLTVVDDAVSGPQVIPITFSGVSGQFGTIPIGGASYFIGSDFLGYGGKGNQTGPAVFITGTNASDFIFLTTNSQQGFSTCDPSTGGCSAPPFYFKPTGTGLRTASLTSSFGGGALSLSGVGVTPPFLGLSYTYGSFAFAGTNQQVGTSTATVTVVNETTSTVTLQTPTITGPNAAAFSVASSSCGGLPPASGSAPGSCTYTVTATTTHLGTYSAVLTFTDITGKLQTLVPINITVIPNSPTVSFAGFPNTQPGTTSSIVYTVITSYNNDPVTLSLTNSSTTDVVQVSGSNQCSPTPCSVGLTFSPSVLGSDNVTLTATDTVTGYTGTANFTASSVAAPQLSITPSSYTFPLRSVGSTSIAQTFTISNQSSLTAIFNSIALGGVNQGDYILTNNCGGSLQASPSSCTLTVSFAPQAAGTRTAAISITSNAYNSPATIQLSGSAQ